MPTLTERIINGLDRGFTAVTQPHLLYLVGPDPQALFLLSDSELSRLTPEARYYILTLRGVDETLDAVIDHPKQVFFREKCPEKIYVSADGTPRNEPPEATGFVLLVEGIRTPNQVYTARHLAILFSQKSRVSKQKQDRILHYVDKQIENNTGKVIIRIGPWEMHIETDRYLYGTVSASLVPVEFDSYIDDYIQHQLAKFVKAVEPQNLTETLLTNAQRNFAISKVSIPAFSLFNLGGVQNREAIETALIQSGWGQVSEVSAEEYDHKNMLLKFRHESNPSAELQLLFTNIKDKEQGNFTIHACSTESFRESLRKQFMPRFQIYVKHAIERNIQLGEQDAIDISPSVLVKQALKELGQELNSEEFAQELPQLCVETVRMLIPYFQYHPQLTTLTEILKKDLEIWDHRDTLIPDVEVNTGWDPTQVRLSFPHDFFQKNS